jgi:hypothetical protein
VNFSAFLAVSPLLVVSLGGVLLMVAEAYSRRREEADARHEGPSSELALGTTIANARVPLMGLLGLLTAPLAFEVSRVLHKGTVEALALSGGAGTLGTATFLLAVVKGVEYGCLGLLVGWVGGRAWGGAAAHVAAGLAVGTVFGGLILGLTFLPNPDAFSAADLLSRGINELLFPVGCSLVLFSARSLAERSTTALEQYGV